MNRRAASGILAGTLLWQSFSYAQSFDAFLTRVNSLPEAQRTAIVDSFMASASTFPFLDNTTTAVYVYRGLATALTIATDANAWSASATPMTLLQGTDFSYYVAHYEYDARLEYKFVLNGTDWFADPLNVRSAPGTYGNSELRMPYYVEPSEITFDPAIPHGSLWDTTFSSTKLGNSRTIRLYTPPSYAASTDSFPLFLFHDGLDYLSSGLMNNVLDNLIAKKRIRPMIALFVPPYNRNAEYVAEQQVPFMEMIVTELLPVIDGRFRTRRDASARGVGGASNGGNISLQLANTYPEIFGNVAVQSSTILPSVESAYLGAPPPGFKISVDVGTYDLSGFLDMSRRFRANLQTAAYTHRYAEYHEGHNWGNWRAHIGKALEFLFPPLPSDVMEERAEPAAFRLLQNFPNPFNPSTTIRYCLGEHCNMKLAVFNTMGQQVALLVDGHQNPGTYEVRFEGKGLSSGTYFYRLHAGRFTATGKLLLLH